MNEPRKHPTFEAIDVWFSAQKTWPSKSDILFYRWLRTWGWEHYYIED